MGRPFSPKNLPLPMGDLNPYLIHGPLCRPKSSTKTASRSVQPFLQGSLVWQTDRQTDRQSETDHATRSLTTDRIYVRSTAMRSNNTDFYKNIITSKHNQHFYLDVSGLCERPSSEEVCSILLPVLATIVMRRGKNRKKNWTSFFWWRSPIETRNVKVKNVGCVLR